jgi:hypothetical protein
MLGGMANVHDPKTITALATVFALPTIEEKVAGACSISSPDVHPGIVNLGRKWLDEPRKAMSNDDCMHEGGWRDSTQHAKVKAGVLRSFLDGKKRLILVDSFYEHLITLIVLSHPIDQPARKGTASHTQFRKVNEDLGGSQLVPLNPPRSG